jgi:carbon-monoxide dehydrogenase large subunit
MEAAQDDIEFADGVFRVVGTDRAVSLQEVAQAAYVPSQLPEGAVEHVGSGVLTLNGSPRREIG